jgi:hypothetical protein
VFRENTRAPSLGFKVQGVGSAEAMDSTRMHGVTSEKTNIRNLHRLRSTELQDDSADELQGCVKTLLSLFRCTVSIFAWRDCRNLGNQFPGWDSTTKQGCLQNTSKLSIRLCQINTDKCTNRPILLGHQFFNTLYYSNVFKPFGSGAGQLQFSAPFM